MVFEEGKIVGNVNLSVSSGGRFFFGFKKCQVLVGFKIGSGHCAKRAVMLCRFGVKGQNKGSVSKARVRITSHSSGPRDARPLNSSVRASRKSLMPIVVTAEQEFIVGSPIVVEAFAPEGNYAAVFEDDEATGYFYALDTSPGVRIVVA